MATQQDIRQYINDRELSKAHIVICAILALAVVYDGYSTFCPGFMIPFVIKPWHLTKGEAGTLMSAGLIGFTVGSIFVGQIADRVGRKYTLLLSLLFSSLLNVTIPLFGDTYVSFIAIRIVAGVGQGALLPLCATLINEVAPRKYVNTLAGIVMAGMGVGGVAGALVGLEAKTLGWPVIYYACGMGIIIFGLGLFLVPESPRFLCLKGDVVRLKRILTLISGEGTGVQDLQFYLPEDKSSKGSLLALFRPRYRRNTITLLAASFCCLFVMYGISAWIPNIMATKFGNVNTGLLMGGFLQLMSVAGMVGCGLIADRRHLLTLVGTWVLGAGGLLVLAANVKFGLALAACGAAGFGVIGGQPLLNNLTAKLYETEVRTSAVGLELGVGRIGAVLGPFIDGLIQQKYPGSFGIFTVTGGAIALAAVIVLFVKHNYVDDVVLATASGRAEERRGGPLQENFAKEL